MSLGQILGESRTSPERSQASPERVPGRSRSSLGQVPIKFRVSLGRVHQFENEMLKIENWFTVFKIVNHFLKIKEEFLVKGKMFSVNYYFMSQ